MANYRFARKMASTWIGVLGIVAGALAMSGGEANAKSAYLTSFNSQYGSSGTALDTCNVCHGSGGTSTWNPYGQAIRSLGSSVAILTRITNVESLDSDGDGFTNIAEITARTFPGDSASTPAPTDTTRPTVGSTNPVAGATAVPAAAAVTATFSEAVKAVSATTFTLKTANHSRGRRRDPLRDDGDLHAVGAVGQRHDVHGDDHHRRSGLRGQRARRGLRLELHHERRPRRHAAHGSLHRSRPTKRPVSRGHRHPCQRCVRRGDDPRDAELGDVQARAGGHAAVAGTVAYAGLVATFLPASPARGQRHGVHGDDHHRREGRRRATRSPPTTSGRSRPARRRTPPRRPSAPRTRPTTRPECR